MDLEGKMLFSGFERTHSWLPLWGSCRRRLAVTLRPQACASEQPPVGRLLASRREGFPPFFERFRA